MNELVELRAGPLVMQFDPQQAFLRYVCLGDQEIVRTVFAAIRDRDWNTIAFTVTDLQIEQQAERFLISFKGKCEQLPFGWEGSIRGTAEGKVEYHFVGKASGAFLKNRIGLCVLHPNHPCAGKPCRVVHCDGQQESGSFPALISPHQPFKDMQSIAHEVQCGVTATVSFAGEAFEMEDQRNWTDASFKTYSTPLDLPFPVELKAGDCIEHRVTIAVVGSQREQVDLQAVHSHLGTNRSNSVQISLDSSCRMPRPAIGFSMATCEAAISPAIIERLGQLHPDHLRVDLDLTRQAWRQAATEALDVAGRVGCRIEAAVFAANARDSIWKDFESWLVEHQDQLARLLVFHPSEKATPTVLSAEVAAALQARQLEFDIAYGTNAYFAELNRNRFEIAGPGCVCYSINPQVHAFDNLSLCETLSAQPETVESAHAIYGRDVVISPITLRPRFNPNATSAEVSGSPPVPETDPRQSTDFAAAWTVGAVSRLLPDPRVRSLTFYETFGPRGIMDASASLYPMYQVFRSVLKGESVCAANVEDPLSIAALGVYLAGGEFEIFLANMSSRERAGSRRV